MGRLSYLKNRLHCRPPSAYKIVLLNLAFVLLLSSCFDIDPEEENNFHISTTQVTFEGKMVKKFAA